MVKPIAVLYIPRTLSSNGGQEINPFELALGFNGESYIYKMTRELYQDYLWFCFPSDDNDFTMEVFHPKDFTEIQYNELKQLIISEISKIQTTNK